MPRPISVSHRAADRFEIAVGAHRLTVDQPAEDGGTDLGPTPTELFVAGLVSCVAFYVRRFLDRHGLPTDGLSVGASYTMESRPARVGSILIDLRLPEGLPEDRRGALLAVAEHCTVENSLQLPPTVVIEPFFGLPKAS